MKNEEIMKNVIIDTIILEIHSGRLYKKLVKLNSLISQESYLWRGLFKTKNSERRSKHIKRVKQHVNIMINRFVVKRYPDVKVWETKRRGSDLCIDVIFGQNQWYNIVMKRF